jgi:hypothetical protein
LLRGLLVPVQDTLSRTNIEIMPGTFFPWAFGTD